jgi:hypothetical protein
MATIKVLQKQNNQLKDQLAAKAKEVKIETSLEKVRAIALRMKEPADMLKICRTICLQLEKLGVEEIRNVQTAIFYPDKGSYMNYEFYARHDKTFITDTVYTNHKIAKAFAKKMMEGKGNFYITNIRGAKVKEWLAYQKTTNVFIDKYLKKASSLNYYWYSLGPVALGISTYEPLPREDQDLFKRFLKVFELAYRRYLDIEKAQAQANEAQIQVALEKVRARTMAMHTSHDIGETVDAMFREMNALGLGAIRCGISIIQPDCKMEVWTANPDVKGKINLSIGTFDISIHPEFIKIYEAWKQKKRVHMYELKGKHLTSYFKALNDAPDYPTRYDLSRLPKFQITNCFFFREGTLFVFTTTPLGEASSKIIERFSALFGQTYRRFLDLQRAEAQARDAEIELALERVRARTMAMQRSEELQELVHTVLERLKDLNVEFYTAIIILFTKDSKDITWWLENKEKQQYARVLVPYTNITYLKDLFDTRKNGRDHFSKVYSFQEKNELFQHLFSATDFKHVPQKQRKFLLESEAASMSVALAKNTGIHLTRYTDKAFSAADNEILKRFARVFEQAYTRFLDLQKAEGQAREAQIQLALERVRAKSLAMHHSSELQEVVNIVAQQLQNMNIDMNGGVFICINKEVDKDAPLWAAAGAADYVQKVVVPNSPIPIISRLGDAIKKGNNFLVEEFSNEEKKEFFRHLFRHEPWNALPAERKKELLSREGGYTRSVAVMQYTSIAMINHNGKRFSDAENEILKRFANVFEQSYVRFLDLQKAEAQAREAQIEAALERVRSKTMAMHNSSELLPAAELLFEQVQQLGAQLQGVAFAICNRENYMVQKWTSIGVFSHRYDIDPVEERMYKSWKNQEGMYEEIIEGERQKKYYQAFMQIPSFRQGLQKFIDSGYPLPTWQKNHAVPFKYGYVLFITLKPFDETQIFLRFGNVFEQTYTRFLDLQKAEAQARESQIQLALERVRARTMAMQKSDELSEAVFVLFQQFKELGENPDQATIGVINEKEHVIEYWVTMYGNQMNKVFKFSIDEPHVTNKIYHAWKKGMKSLVIDLSGKELLEFMTYRAGKGGAAVNHNEKRRIINVAFFSKGLLIVQSTIECSAESTRLLERFASVFEQTYTRFLDLKRAEAQAREAQIEVALERVRARAMAMHASQELKEIALELRKQMGLLGQKELETCAIHLYDESPDYFQSWAALRPPNTEGDIIQRESRFPKHGVKIIEEMMECYQSNKKDYVLVNDGEKALEFFEMVKQHSGKVFEVLSESFQGLAQEDIKAYWSVADFKGGSLVMTTMVEPEETTRTLLRRFANVFGLAYRRFMDLKQAEAQAREATIEAALEKVRGKAMAMHNSNDVAITASMVFTELRKLGIRPIRCGVGLLSNESRKAGLYSATSSTNEDSLSLIGWVQLEKHPVLEKIYESWLQQEDYFPELEGEQLISYYKLLLAGLPVPVPDFSNEQKQFGHFISFSVGCLYAWSEIPYKAEEINVLKRFAGIIDLTFRRYLELQQSEANAKEAVRQAVLDRIRADIASMRTTADLNRIIPLVWNELTILGLPFIRCGVFIMDNEHQLIHTFLSTPEGKAIAAFKIPYDTPGKIRMIRLNWQNNTAYIDHWNDTDFTDFANTLLEQEVIDSAGEYLAGVPHGGFY